MLQSDLSLEIQVGGPGEPLRLCGHANPYQAVELHARLCRYLLESARPSLDLSGLASCDTLSLQLLFAVNGRAELAGAMPTCITERCAALGLPLPLGESESNGGRGPAQ
jgi:hypothetical protein